MALFGGVYVTCMIGLLPDKTKETYERFFAMVSAYLEANDLPTNFEGHFFMTDFEKNIRNSFHLFWPSVRGGNQVGPVRISPMLHLHRLSWHHHPSHHQYQHCNLQLLYNRGENQVVPARISPLCHLHRLSWHPNQGGREVEGGGQQHHPHHEVSSEHHPQ